MDLRFALHLALLSLLMAGSPCQAVGAPHQPSRRHDAILKDEWDSLLGLSTVTQRRRKLYFGSMDAWNSQREPLTVQFVNRRSISETKEFSDSLRPVPQVRRSRRGAEGHDSNGITLYASSRDNSKFWPPWPFSLFSGSQKAADADEEYSYRTRSNVSVFWVFLQHNLRVGFRQMQHVGSQLWFHLPPATPPLILLGFRPVRRTVFESIGEMEEVVTKTVGPAILANPFVRKLTLASVCAAVLSWSHSELNRGRRLEPLPLPDPYRDVSKAILPPFLPEDVPEPEKEFLRSMETRVRSKTDRAGQVDEHVQGNEKGLSPKIKRHLQQIYDVAPSPKTFRATFTEWRRVREARRLEAEKVRRATIADELIALQALKRRAQRRKKAPTTTPLSGEELGYALVTGSSRGIGRAIAVELARWEIPLILVARDVDRLSSLASDIETCYGVKCCVLQADLSQPDAAERVYRTTQNAGLKVDVLINNAGISSSGECVDMSSSQIQEMLQVNVMSVASLNHFYGKEMKDRRRGRILVISSVVGSVEAGPKVAVYAATKSFEKSLATSMAKELEPYGVGVTCLLPGAVRGTEFRSRSGSTEALCWKLPFYPKRASDVASMGVRAMLTGDVECVPGWQNRAFLRVFKPVLPQRLTTLVVEMAWSPFQLSWRRVQSGNTRKGSSTGTSRRKQRDDSAPAVTPDEILDPLRRVSPQRTPRLLNMNEPPEEEVGPKASTNDSISEAAEPTISSESDTEQQGSPVGTSEY